MSDLHPQLALRLSAPAYHAIEVTPSDTVDLLHPSTALFVGVTGDVEVIMEGGETIVFTAAIGWLPIRVSRVKAANTTATGIVAVY